MNLTALRLSGRNWKKRVLTLPSEGAPCKAFSTQSERAADTCHALNTSHLVVHQPSVAILECERPGNASSRGYTGAGETLPGASFGAALRRHCASLQYCRR